MGGGKRAEVLDELGASQPCGPQKYRLHTSGQPRSAWRQWAWRTLVSQQGAFAIMTCPRLCRNLVQFVGTVLVLLGDSGRFLGLCVRSHAALAAENRFLRKQLAL